MEGDKDGGRRGGRAFNDKTTAANDYDVFMEFYTGQQQQQLHKCQEQNLIQFFMTLLSSQWQIPNPYSFSHSSFPLRILLTWNEKLEHEICVWRNWKLKLVCCLQYLFNMSSAIHTYIILIYMTVCTQSTICKFEETGEGGNAHEFK